MQILHFFFARVEAHQRKQNETINSSDTGGAAPSPTHYQGDDVFPTRKAHRTKKNGTGSASNSSKLSATPAGNGTENSLIDKNNENDGQLFLASGKPFWQQVGREKPGDEDEVTNDELPMNADMILDVHRGKIKLKDMPTVAVMLDPYGKLPNLEKHDNLFFTRDVIFSNTFRSMINLNDKTEHHRNKTIIRKCQWKIPSTIHRSSKADISTVKTEDFVAKCPERK